MRNITIKYRVILLLALVLATAFIVMAVINYRVQRSATRQEILTSSLPLTGENIYSELHATLLKPLFISSLMASDTFLKDWAIDGEHDVSKIQRYLQTIQDRYGFFAAFFVSSHTSNYYYPQGILKQVRPEDPHDDWFYQAMDMPQEYDLDVDTNQAAENRLTIFINYRLRDHDGNMLGITGVGLAMDHVARLLDSYQRKYHRIIYMVDKNGLVQSHSDRTRIMQVNIHDLAGLGALADKILVPRKEPAQFEYDDAAGNHVLLSARYIPEFDWYLLVAQDEGDTLGTARSNLLRTLLVGLALTLVIILVIVWAMNHFQRRLDHLTGGDELTALPTRTEFEARFRRAMNRRARYGLEFCLVRLTLVGLEDFRRTQGRTETDALIRSAAHIIEDGVRVSDVAARWRDNEFVVLVE